VVHQHKFPEILGFAFITPTHADPVTHFTKHAPGKGSFGSHPATKAGTLGKCSTDVNFDEQIVAIHRAKGLLGSYVLSIMVDSESTPSA
jgi:hypothetical protein